MSLGDQLNVIRIAAVSMEHITGDVNVSLQGLIQSSNLGVGRVLSSRGSTQRVTMVGTKGQNFRSTMIVYCSVTKLMCWFFFFYLFLFFLILAPNLYVPKIGIRTSVQLQISPWCAACVFIYVCDIKSEWEQKPCHFCQTYPTLTTYCIKHIARSFWYQGLTSVGPSYH